ncbi:MAG: phenylalanine--tRNA ligase subunit beta [Cyanophyceae cyanobacterium]
MRISLNWLRELVEFSLSPEELAQTLTIAGFEVEDIEDRRTFADGVVIGLVQQCDLHPNADKLRVCRVDIGQNEPVTIVCGAANVRATAYVCVATTGTYLPAVDLKIKSAKLRGVRSEGMICSLQELGLEKDSEGIYIFPDKQLQPGDDVRPLLGLDDIILDLTATANRSDALSMVGVAREVAALTGDALKLPSAPELTIAERDAPLAIADNRACPAYIGTTIEGVTMAPSPEWLQQRLLTAGVRPISNVVDVTNYILLEWGQPLHAFDRDRLRGEQISVGVRFAREGETLQTLDGQQRFLDSENLLITAGDRPVALAGVMGGEETEVHAQTQNVFLEAALFDPVTIRRSARRQSLRTEASARYERGINQAELKTACNRAIALMVELAGGKVTRRTIHDARPDLSKGFLIELRLERVRQVLGPVVGEEQPGKIEAADVERILSALGCQLQREEVAPARWFVTVPPYRHRDLEREIDLIEEIARLYGYDRFCDELPDKTEPGYLSLAYQVQQRVRFALQAVGLTEVVQYSLVKPEANEITLANPLFAEYSALRTNLLDGLINAFAYNQSQGNGALNAFEIGRVFRQHGGEFQEADAVAGIIGGDYAPVGRWTRGGKAAPLTWHEAKGFLETVFESLGPSVEYQPTREDKRLHPGRTASLWLEGKRLGIFGQLHPQLRQQKDLPEAVYGFEISFNLIREVLGGVQATRFRSYSSYPAVERDLAFVAAKQVAVADIERVMYKAGGTLLAGVELFDQYQGQNMAEGERSLAFSLFYRAGDRNLTAEEVEPVHNKIREALVEQFNVTLRS